MRNFDDSTLWKISEFQRMRAETGNSGFARLAATTSLSMSLSAELTGLDRGSNAGDVLGIVAACVRQRESALILLRHNDLVWPLTLLPQQGLYHLARPIIESLEAGNLDLKVVAVEPPGMRPPRYDELHRLAEQSNYRRLPPLLWALALNAPDMHLLADIGGHAAYRLAADFIPEPNALAGALGPALKRLRRQIASLDDISAWPGMDRERATRLLNGAYLLGGLMVLRTHAAARHEHSRGQRLREWLRAVRRP